MDKILTITQAAEILECTPDNVRRARRAGLLEATKFGNSYMLMLSEVMRYKAERRKPGRPPFTRLNIEQE
jgi:excisionase family DNA binding protein